MEHPNDDDALAPIIEAPFTHEAPFNVFAYYATFHRQPETMGMLHDLCLDGKRLGLASACIGGGQGIALALEVF
jgi:hypothetical protein